VSQRSRHEYAADIPRDLPGQRSLTAPEVPAASVYGGTHRARPRSARFRAGVAVEGRDNAGSSRTPFRHARRTRTIWQYWHVPALSGLLPPSPAPPGSGCPQLHQPAATDQQRRSLTSTRTSSASRRKPKVRQSQRCYGVQRHLASSLVLAAGGHPGGMAVTTRRNEAVTTSIRG
jgi:hypothetical protein